MYQKLGISKEAIEKDKKQNKVKAFNDENQKELANYFKELDEKNNARLRNPS